MGSSKSEATRFPKYPSPAHSFFSFSFFSSPTSRFSLLLAILVAHLLPPRSAATSSSLPVARHRFPPRPPHAAASSPSHPASISSLPATTRRALCLLALRFSLMGPRGDEEPPSLSRCSPAAPPSPAESCAAGAGDVASSGGGGRREAREALCVARVTAALSRDPARWARSGAPPLSRHPPPRGAPPPTPR